MTAKLTVALWRNDLLPALSITAGYLDGDPVDLTAATSPRFRMRAAGSATLKVDAVATVTDGPTGVLTYQWAGDDTDTAGIYRAEFEVTLDGKPLTFPAPDQALEVVIREELG